MMEGKAVVIQITALNCCGMNNVHLAVSSETQSCHPIKRQAPQSLMGTDKQDQT